jgi:hypothetical protein
MHWRKLLAVREIGEFQAKRVVATMDQIRSRTTGINAAVLVLLLMVGSVPGWTQAPRYVPGRLLVKFRANTSREGVSGVLAAFQAREDRELPDLGVKILSLPPNANPTALERAFRGRAEVEFAELDRLLPPDQVTPNDPQYGSQ